MCCQNEMTYAVLKQRERIDKMIQCDKDVFEIYKAFDMINIPEIKELFETEIAPKLQDVRHKYQEEI